MQASDVLITENQRLAQKENSQLTFNLDNDRIEVNPLVQFIQSKNRYGSYQAYQERMHIFYYKLLFCKNPKLPPPLQNTLADVEVCSGSRQFKILNRLALQIRMTGL